MSNVMNASQAAASAPLSRRGFVAATGAGILAGVAASSAAHTAHAVEASAAKDSTSAASSAADAADGTETNQWAFDQASLPALSGAKEECDVVVVGAGFGGFTATITAAEEGLNVIQLKALDQVGGSAVYTEGSFAINSQITQDAGFYADADKIRELIDEEMEDSHYRANHDQWIEIMNGQGAVIDWMCDMGVTFEPVSDILGRSDRFVVNLVYDGHGAAAIQAMQARAEELGVTARCGHRAEHLYLQDGRVQGVLVSGPDGEYTIKSKAVILACGGYADNPTLIRQKTGFDPTRIVFTGAAGTGSGDGIRMAYEVGADQTGVACPGFVWAIIDGVPPFNTASVAACNEQHFWVNQYGKRFVNEDLVYNIAGICNVILGQKHVWSILDQDEVDRLAVEPCTLGWGAYVPVGSVMSTIQDDLDGLIEQNLPNVVKADTIEALAGLIDVDAQNLQDSVDRYNELCAEGTDTDFGKGPSVMHPVGSGPYYAFELYADAPVTIGGIRIDPAGRVLDGNFDPIPGLFSGSCDNSGLEGDTYRSELGGVTSGTALYWDRRSAQEVANYIQTA
ncbi:MAG: FAD-dependent oxidoreductase [Coriobacteriales bacterium]|jgi:fumarate reductase flavoprotein subunit